MINHQLLHTSTDASKPKQRERTHLTPGLLTGSPDLVSVAPPALSAHDPLPRPASPRPARRPRSPPRICNKYRFINIIMKLYIKLMVSTLDCRCLEARAGE